MIHTKSLIRRLAYVPWLLAFGLVLGWAGEAQATITITLDKQEVREEAGLTMIKVTAKTDAILTNATAVILDFGETEPTDSEPSFGSGTKTEFGNRTGALAEGVAPDPSTFDRYLITLPTLTFAAAAAVGAIAEDVITFTPLDDDIIGNGNADPNDIRIWIMGSTTGGPNDLLVADTEAYFYLTDNDQMSTSIQLNYSVPDDDLDEDKISQDGDPTEVTVTASLNGATLKDDLEFDLLIDGGEPMTGRAIRDKDYRAVMNSITIEGGEPSGDGEDYYHSPRRRFWSH